MKKFLAAALAASLFASPLFATESRLNGMGIANWMIEEDDNLIFLNPSRILDHSKTVWAELGIATPNGVDTPPNVAINNQWGGISGMFPLGEDSVFGVFVSRPYSGIVGNAGEDPMGSDISGIPADLGPWGGPMTAINVGTPEKNKFDLFYSLPLNRFSLGFRLSSASNGEKLESSQTTAAGTNETSITKERGSSDTSLAIGGRFEDIGVISDLDVILNLGLPSVKNTYLAKSNAGAGWITENDWELKTNSALNFGLSARAVFPARGQSAFIGYLGYQSDDVSNSFALKYDQTANGSFNDIGANSFRDDLWVGGDKNWKQDRTQQRSLMTVGAAYNARTSPRTIIVAATALQMTTNKYDAETTQQFTAQPGINEAYKDETTDTVIPVRIGLEHQLTDIITARFGVAQNIYHLTTDKITNPNYGAWNAGTSDYPLTVTGNATDSFETIDPTVVSIGAGINLFKGLTIDAVIRQQVLFTGTYLVSGVPETLFGQLSAIYKF